MGLDIYLKKYNNYENTISREKKYSDFSEEIWKAPEKEYGDYDKIPEEVKESIRKKTNEYAASLGLNSWGSDEDNIESAKKDHPDYPDHYFKIGYFRSSYNESGINRILSNFGLMTLDGIFNHDGEYHFQPDWEASKKRAQVTLEEFKKQGNYRVEAMYTHSLAKDFPKTSDEALKVYMEELERTKESRAKNPDSEAYNYSNAKGAFFPAETLKVHAVIPGTNKYIFDERPCLFVIKEGNNDWYIQALEIVIATCNYALEQENINQYYLHWSG
jgi:hypothetical protein